MASAGVYYLQMVVLIALYYVYRYMLVYMVMHIWVYDNSLAAACVTPFAVMQQGLC